MPARSALAIRKPFIKLLVFIVVTTLVLFVVATELGGFRSGDRTTYSAMFADSSGMTSGSSVRIAGVEVGTVEDVTVIDSSKSKVEFAVTSSRQLNKSVTAAIRYENLIGDRYLELRDGGAGPVLPASATIPIAQTEPALDLDVLLGGLQPLFEGLQPQQINELSQQVISILQGQGGTVESILSHVGSLTGTLADKDALIGNLVNNLNRVLTNLDKHEKQFGTTIDGLQKLVTGLANDRRRLGRSLGTAGDFAGGLQNLLTDLRPPLRGMVNELGRASRQAQRGSERINEVLRLLPGAYYRIGRLGSRGSLYNMYICSLRLQLTGPNGESVYTPWLGPNDNVDRCKPGVAPLETPEERMAAEQASGQASSGDGG